MKRIVVYIGIILLFISCANNKENVCVMQTNMGTMAFKFFEEDAPLTCAQIQKLVSEGKYDGLDFYRVVEGFVIQCGGEFGDKVKAEFNSRPHLFGTVGMGRTGGPDSGDSEIYICLDSIPRLDGKYTVFGQLIEGLDVLKKIGNVEVEKKKSKDGKEYGSKPIEKVIIEKVTLKKRKIK